MCNEEKKAKAMTLARRVCHEGIRVGSSLLIHDCSSFALGAERAYEFEAVKRVNMKRF